MQFGFKFEREITLNTRDRFISVWLRSKKLFSAHSEIIVKKKRQNTKKSNQSLFRQNWCLRTVVKHKYAVTSVLQTFQNSGPAQHQNTTRTRPRAIPVFVLAFLSYYYFSVRTARRTESVLRHFTVKRRERNARYVFLLRINVVSGRLDVFITTYYVIASCH